MNSGKVLLGVLAGIATGALLGVLFAPGKGSSTRKKIYKKGEDYADGLKEQFDDCFKSISEKIQKAKEEISVFAEEQKAKPEEVKKHLKTASD
jgi:gas vesicle protein